MKESNMSNGPSAEGLQKSIAFEDRFGIAGAVFLPAVKGSGLIPVFSHRVDCLHGTAGSALTAARHTIEADHFEGCWGANADGLETAEQVAEYADAGYSWFTLDGSQWVVKHASMLSLDQLQEGLRALVEDQIFPDTHSIMSYAGRELELSATCRLQFDEETVMRAAVKFGWVVASIEEFAAITLQKTAGRKIDLEVTLFGTGEPLSPLESLFIHLELQKRGVHLSSFGPVFPGRWENAVDWEGDAPEFEEALTKHAAIARSFGHKLSIDDATDKLSVLPLFAKCCGDLIHLRALRTDWLEALRLISRAEPTLFREVLVRAQERFPFDRSRAVVSISEADIRFLPEVSDAALEQTFLDDWRGRQLLSATANSILNDAELRDPLMKTIEAHQNEYQRIVREHLEERINAFKRG